MKWILAVAFCTLSASVLAQTCDLNMSMVYAGPKVGKVTSTVSYVGITKDQATDINKRSQAVLDAASKAQDGGGQDAFTFAGTTTCGFALATVEVGGVQRNKANQIWHKALDVGHQTVDKLGK